MDFLLVFLISPKLVVTTYKTEQREYYKSMSRTTTLRAALNVPNFKSLHCASH